MADSLSDLQTGKRGSDAMHDNVFPAAIQKDEIPDPPLLGRNACRQESADPRSHRPASLSLHIHVIKQGIERDAEKSVLVSRFYA